MSNTEPLPPPVHEILMDRDQVRKRYPLSKTNRIRRSNITIHPLFHLLNYFYKTPSSFTPEDTPSASLYRMYEFLIADWTVQLRNELEYFCRERSYWRVCDIPNPSDSDPLRYAVLGVITKLMCISFNRRIDLGLPRDAPAIIEDFEELAARPRVHECPPPWALNVRPLEERVFIPDENGAIPVVEDSSTSAEFMEMNIIINAPHIHFI